MVTTFFPLYVYGDFSRRSKAANSAVLGPIWLNFELVPDVLDVLVTCKNKEDLIKMKALEWSQDFPHYNPMGAICCHGNQNSDPIWPKTYCSLFPIPMMLQFKVSVYRTRTIGPLVYAYTRPRLSGKRLQDHWSSNSFVVYHSS